MFGEFFSPSRCYLTRPTSTSVVCVRLAHSKVYSNMNVILFLPPISRMMINYSKLGVPGCDKPGMGKLPVPWHPQEPSQLHNSPIPALLHPFPNTHIKKKKLHIHLRSFFLARGTVSTIASPGEREPSQDGTNLGLLGITSTSPNILYNIVMKSDIDAIPREGMHNQRATS